MILNIKVLDSHIRRGRIAKPCSCPVALAVVEVYPTLFPKVTEGSIGLIMSGDDKWFDLPDNACKFVVDFDKGMDVLPFEFSLDIKQEIL